MWHAESVTAYKLAAGAPYACLVVAASDAPAKAKATADYVCDGTHDEVEIQAAIDVAYAAGGGQVQLTAGTFYLQAPTGVDECYGTCTTVAFTDLIGTLSFTAGDIDDVAAGDFIMLWDGDNGGNKMEANREDIILVVDSVGATSIDFGTAGITNDYTTAKFVRLRFALELKDHVYIRGEGINATTLQPKAGENISGVKIGKDTSPGKGIRDVTLHGRGAGTLGHCHGIVKRGGEYDGYFVDISVDHWMGHGIYGLGWGYLVRGGWVEYNRWDGVVLSGYAKVQGFKMFENGYSEADANIGSNLVLRGANNLITGCEIGQPATGAYNIEILTDGNDLSGIHIVNGLGIYLTGKRNYITGVVQPGADLALTLVGAMENTIDMSLNSDSLTGEKRSGWGYSIIGNVVRGSGWTHKDREESFSALNGSGVEIAARQGVCFTAADPTKLELATAAAAHRWAGFCWGTIGAAALPDGGVGIVLRKGFTSYCPVTGTGSIGDPLTFSATAGSFKAASSGELVVAISCETWGAPLTHLNAIFVDPFLMP